MICLDLLKLHASHSVVEGPGPLIIAPSVAVSRCLITSGPGWPIRACQTSPEASDFFGSAESLGYLFFFFSTAVNAASLAS